MTTPPRRPRSDSPLSPQQIAAFRAAIDAGEIDPLAPMVPDHLADMLTEPGAQVARKPAPRRKPGHTVGRDGAVILDGEVIGYVNGEPRNWQFILADYRKPAGRLAGSHMWHSKRQAAEMCVEAHRTTPPRARKAAAKRRHGGGHPRASPEATKAVLAAFDAGENVQTAAAAGDVSGPTARRIWDREHPGQDPPGLGKGRGKGGGNPNWEAAVSPEQARQAIKDRGPRTPGGDWTRSIPSIAAEMGVTVKALRWAIAKEEKRTEERKQS